MDRVSNRLHRETLAVLALTLLGAVLRLWQCDRLGLQHFDEGIYAQAGLWIVRPGGLSSIDRDLIFYAPPGLPLLIGLSYLFLGISDLSAIAVSLACGTLAIPAVAWVARRTWGPGGGTAAAALVTLSGPHVAFSRMALTDVPFLLLWILCLGLGGRFLERPGLRSAVGLGVVIGLAQNLKYNGWLAGVIVGLAALGGCWRVDESRGRNLFRIVGWGLVAGSVAGMLYLPWYRFVDRAVGYPTLLAHHRSYMGGPSSWLDHWSIQLAESTALAGKAGWGFPRLSWGVMAGGLSWAACALVVRGRPQSEGGGARRWLASILPLGAITVSLGLLPNLPWWVGLGWSFRLLIDGRPAARMLAASWIVLSALTPLYHPYARLWLPLHGVGWLVLGGLIVRLHDNWLRPMQAVREGLTPIRAFVAQHGLIVTSLVLAAAQAIALTPRAEPLSGLLDPSDSLRTAVSGAVESWPRKNRAISVVARPPVIYYLVLDGRASFAPRASIEPLLAPGNRSGWALLDSVQVGQEGPRAIEQLGRLRPVRSWPTRLNLPTLLDTHPGAAMGEPASPSGRIDLVNLSGPPS